MNFFDRYKLSLALVLILLASIGSLAVHRVPEEERGLLTRAAATVTTPLQSLLVGTADGVASMYNGYIALWKARRFAETVDQENKQLKQQLWELEQDRQQNLRLKRLLDFKQQHDLRFISARVIGISLEPEFHRITLDVGYDDRVDVGDAVTDADGLVGKVIETTASRCVVQLMSDPDSSMDGRVERTRSRGIIKGMADRKAFLCEFAFSLRTEDVREGDRIVTSGLDSTFPAGLPLGVVVKSGDMSQGIFREAMVKPYADLSRLEEVFVAKRGVEER